MPRSLKMSAGERDRTQPLRRFPNEMTRTISILSQKEMEDIRSALFFQRDKLIRSPCPIALWTQSPPQLHQSIQSVKALSRGFRRMTPLFYEYLCLLIYSLPIQ